MSYNNNLINQPNMNTPGQNALQDSRTGGTVNSADVLQGSLVASQMQPLNTSYGSSAGDSVDNTEGANPVKTAFASPVLQVSLQKTVTTVAYPPRTNQGLGY